MIKNYSTIGLPVTHASLTKPTAVRVEFDVYGDDDVRVYAVSANNLNRMPTLGSAVITRRELSELPDDPYNEVVFAEAAFALLSLNISR